jgi:predicted ATP-grasp superfamily ATP-dependent carboligase
MAGIRGSVLVTDGEQRSALACTRALGKAGWSCFVVGAGKRTLAGSSRHCVAYAEAPDPSLDPPGFLEALQRRLDEWGCDTLVPMTEKSLRVVLPEREAFPGVTIPFPPAETFSTVSDKGTVLEKARELEIQIPEQWILDSREGVATLEIPEDRYPLAVKPTRSVVLGEEASVQVGVAYLSGPEELRSHIRILPEAAFPILIQQRIHGPGVGVFLLTWGGELKAVVGHRRVREKPPSGGVSVVRQSTTVDPWILDRSQALLSALGWEDGVAMVEYKIQHGTETPYLMEINGRFWGSLQLAIDAGVDFPTLLLRCASGDSPSTPVVGAPGVTTRWLLGDLDQLLLRILKKRAALDLPPSEAGRIRSVLSFLGDFRPGVRNEVLRFSDKRPFITEASGWLRALLRS